jgi:hypothetical protein
MGERRSAYKILTGELEEESLKDRGKDGTLRK